MFYQLPAMMFEKNTSSFFSYKLNYSKYDPQSREYQVIGTADVIQNIYESLLYELNKMGKTLSKTYDYEIKKDIKKFKNSQNKLRESFTLIKNYNKLLQFSKHLNIGIETNITEDKMKEFLGKHSSRSNITERYVEMLSNLLNLIGSKLNPKISILYDKYGQDSTINNLNLTNNTSTLKLNYPTDDMKNIYNYN
jgi:DNA helicase HerA-like ATPase